MKLADKYRTTGHPHQRRPARPGENAIAFGAEGIGLCRTEHMFFEGDRIDRDAADDPGRDQEAAAGLAKLLPHQQKDFEGIFRALERPAGLHPPARSAAARIPAARRQTAAARRKSLSSSTPWRR
jgi:hypothetical protein